MEDMESDVVVVVPYMAEFNAHHICTVGFHEPSIWL